MNNVAAWGRIWATKPKAARGRGNVKSRLIEIRESSPICIVVVVVVAAASTVAVVVVVVIAG